jgi:hypothetical protein
MRQERFRGRNHRSKPSPGVEEIQKAVTGVCAADTRIVAAWLFGMLAYEISTAGSDREGLRSRGAQRDKIGSSRKSIEARINKCTWKSEYW